MHVGVLITATIAMGLMAGVFAIYANAIMPGLGRTDDRTFVGAFQSIDTAIINPAFLGTFLGALVFTGFAAVLHLAMTSGRSYRGLWPLWCSTLPCSSSPYVSTFPSTTVSRRPETPIASPILPWRGSSSTNQSGSVSI